MGKKVIIQFILSSFTGLVAFLALVLAARFFGPTVLGQIAYYVGLMGFCFAFSDLGLSRAHVYFTASLSDKTRILTSLMVIKLPLIFVCGLAALIVGQWSQPLSAVFVILVLNEIFSRLGDVLLVTFEGKETAWPQNILKLFAKIMKLTAIIGLGLALNNAFSYSLTFLAEAIIIFNGALWLTRQFWSSGFDKKIIRQYVIYALPFALVMPLSYFQENGLIVMIKHFWSSKELGYYSAAFGLFGFLKMFSGSLMTFFFPAISRLYSQKNFVAIQQYTDLAVKFSVTLLLPLLSLLYFTKQLLINILLGPQYSASAAIFGWLLIGVFILAVFAPYDYVLYATRKHKAIIGINLFTTILVLSMSFFLIPNFGAKGAAIANVVGWFLSGLLQFLVLNRKTGIKFCRNFLVNLVEIKYLRQLF